MLELAQRIAALARQTDNYGSTHLFLGNPLSHGCDKTVVEPGNNFSPGIGTFGVSVWIESDGKLVTPDLLSPSDIEWGFDERDSWSPIIQSRYAAGDATVTNRIGHIGADGSNGVDFVDLAVDAAPSSQTTVVVVIKDAGPAGRKIESIAWDASTETLTVNGVARLVFEQRPTIVEIVEPDDTFDSPVAVVVFDTIGSARLAFKAVHGFARQSIYKRDDGADSADRLDVATGLAAVGEHWTSELPSRIHCPDARVARAYECSALHILAAMECGLPRISALNYPIFWIRDCVIVLRALDILGRHDLARSGCDYLVPLLFGGGFGPEADNPGEGIWALVNHAEMTGDIEWLRGVYPQILKRVGWIERMLTTTRPIGWVTENRSAETGWTPDDVTVCLPPNQGTIVGRMDLHLPVFYINCWNIGGLRRASSAACLVGDQATFAKTTAMAVELERNVMRVLMPSYGTNERDAIASPHPTGAFPGELPLLRDNFAKWSAKTMAWAKAGDTSDRPWPYFDCAFAHNAVLLNMPEIAWNVLDRHLDESANNSVHVFEEGYAHSHERLPYKNGSYLRGWLNSAHCGRGNMPHNWAHAEMVLLLRDLFVRELLDGTVSLGDGIRKEWLEPGQSFGVTNMPTSLGPVTYTVSTDANGHRTLRYSGPPNPSYAFHVDAVEPIDTP